jgi:hypothetical protein
MQSISKPTTQDERPVQHATIPNFRAKMIPRNLMLKFKPVDLDMLPLCIVLLLASPFVL